jgi:hypothetical protein
MAKSIYKCSERKHTLCLVAACGLVADRVQGGLGPPILARLERYADALPPEFVYEGVLEERDPELLALVHRLDELYGGEPRVFGYGEGYTEPDPRVRAASAIRLTSNLLGRAGVHAMRYYEVIVWLVTGRQVTGGPELPIAERVSALQGEVYGLPDPERVFGPVRPTGGVTSRTTDIPEVPFDPSWRTPDVALLAQRIYDQHDFSAMPILADALQDAGCDSDDVLNHCRGPGPHVRGCWVCDLVLGKQ